MNRHAKTRPLIGRSCLNHRLFRAARPLFAALFAIFLLSTASVAFVATRPAALDGTTFVHQADNQLQMVLLQIPRRGHTATLLENGTILVVGGENASGPVPQTEVFDPVSLTSSLGPSLLTPRADHTALLLADGRVLIAGGRAGTQPLDSTEIFDLVSSTFQAGPSLNLERSGHTGTVLSDGRYLVIGGDGEGTAEIFDPATQTFALLSATLATARAAHTAVLLQNGKVLTAGGLGQDGNPLSTAELFDPASMTFSPISSEMHSARINPTLRILPDGKVQVIGGDGESTMEMFNAEGEYFTAFTHLITGPDSVSELLRSPARAAVIHLGATSGSAPASAPQARNPQLRRIVPMTLDGDPTAVSEVTDRDNYSMTALPGTNQVLVAGGTTGTSPATGSAALLADSGSATVTTDKTDYSPGMIVVITGTGWQPGETVNFLLHVEPHTSDDTALTPSVADENGNFVNNSFIVRDSDANVTLTLTATGESSGLVALTTFTDLTTGRLLITKTVDWKGSTPDVNQQFSICVQGPAYPTTPDCKSIGYQGGQLQWAGVLTGQYTVTEQNTGSSWTVSISPGLVTVTTNGTGTATVTNTLTALPPKLTVTKVVVGDTIGRFNLQINGNTYASNVGDTGSTGAQTGTIGPNTFGETGGTSPVTSLNDYNTVITGTGCTDNGNGTGGITLAAGDNKTCTITNTKKGSLQITKNVDWQGSTLDPSALFEICVQGPSYTIANCQTIGYQGGPLTWSNLLPGQYTVIETGPGDSWTSTGSPITVSVSPGAQATATVTNTLKLGKLIVTKVVVTQATVPSQNFSICILGPSYSQGNCQSIGMAGGPLAWNNLIPGPYTISETDPGSSWIVSGIPAVPVYVSPGATRSDVTITNTLKIVGTLQLTKTANPTSYSAAGQVIGYTLVAQNNTNVTLSNVTITDPMFPTLSCSQASLAASATLTCTSSYTVKQADVDAGSITNTATASGTFGGQTVSDTKSVTVNATRNPVLLLSKTANPMSYAGPGVAISYTLAATNGGNVTLTAVSITDSKLGSLNCVQPVSLVPGAVLTCTGSYSTTQLDVDTGSVVNAAAASGTFNSAPVNANPASITVRASQTTRLLLTMTVTEKSYNSVGDVLHYNLIATNGGNVTLTNVSIVDPLVASLSCTQPTSLAPGAALTCTGSHPISQGDLDATFVKNTATAGGFFGTSPVDADPASVTVNASTNPHISLTKSADSTGYNVVGSVLHYTLVALNNGNVTLSNVSIADPKLPSLLCAPTQPATLAPGATLSCNGNYLTVQADVDTGSVTNTATASGSFGSQTVSDTKTVIVTATRNPHLSLTKTASPMAYNSAGTLITYTLVATNDGNVTLTGVNITDPKFTSLNCTQPVSLVPGSALTCSGSYSITQADLDAGAVTNTANAAGMFGTTSIPANPASVTVAAAQNIHLSLSKAASPMTYGSVGTSINYTLVAKNDGNVTLTNVSITDPKFASLNCAQSISLVPGAALTCTGSHAITQTDIDAGSVTNTAGAGGKFATTLVNAVPASVTVNALQSQLLSLTKSASPTTYSAPDDVITYVYVLKNSGNVTLGGPFTVSDDKTTVTCPATPMILAPGASIACSAAYKITKTDLIAGTVTNIATGFAKFSNTTVSSNQAGATVTANIPSLGLSCLGGYVPAGKPFSVSLAASGGVPPYTFSITSGTLPPGLTLNPSTGAITGTPTTAGSFSFTAKVVDYRGNSAGTATSSCGALLVYQESQFVIWGGNPPIPSGQTANVTIGQDYNFWGAQWWKQVLGGDWTANASFKGYANQVDRIGGTWTTSPGNSSGPPDSVGDYISVIVATHATKQGSEIGGNIAEIAIIKVDNPSAYGPNPGHSGSGVIIAILPRLP
ncbi:MAG: kelch repeat-containing protein [Acidobacteriota bacterium]